MELIKRDGFYWKEDIIAACKAVHGDKYDYSQIQEKIANKDCKIPIICHNKDSLGNEHGVFLQPLSRHLNNRNCPKCVGKNVTLSDEEILARAKKVHNDEYEYISVTRNENNRAFIKMICHVKDENGKEHGEFVQSYHHHVIRAQGCPICRYIKSAASKRRTLDETIRLAREIHGDKYDYSQIKEYKNDRIPYPIRCKIHDYTFMQNFNNHINFKHGCPICGIEKCAESRRYTLQEWIDIATEKHKGKYGYDRVHETFDNEDGMVWIYCKKHKEYFKQRKTNHLFGQGCPICKESKLEIEITNLLTENKFTFSRQHTFDWLRNVRNLYLDFYLPEYNIAIECQGKQHFKCGGWTNDEQDYLEIEQRDNLKRKLCEEHGIKILYYSNLGIEYPYKVIENKEELLTEIKNHE